MLFPPAKDGVWGCRGMSYLLHLCYNFLSFVLKQKKETEKQTKNLVIRWISEIMTWQFIVGGISILLLREGGVPVGGGGRWMRKSVIISIVYPPTTPAFSHPSFPKEGNGDTTDWVNYHQIWRRTSFYRFNSHALTNSLHSFIHQGCSYEGNYKK